MAPPTTRPHLDLEGRERVQRARQPVPHAARPAHQRRLQRVADAVHGADQPRSELAPQRLDVAVDGAALHAGRPSPHVFEQGLAGHRGPWPARQEGEHVEFDSGQVDFLGHRGERGAPAGRFDSHRPKAAAASADPVHAAQQHADPGDEFAHAERFGQVVVGADAEADQHVRLVASGGQHQHRRRPHRLDPSAYLQTVESGQHHVEHHQIRFGGRRRRDRRRPVDGGFHQEFLGAQPSRDGGQDGRLVVDHQDSLHTPDCRCQGVVLLGSDCEDTVEKCRRQARSLILAACLSGGLAEPDDGHSLGLDVTGRRVATRCGP